MNSIPFFSVIIPCYNCQDTIKSAIDSIVDQQFNSYEIILIDDCSSDNTFQVITSISQTNDKIRIYRNNTNHGPGYSRNIGLDNASGEFICFLDSDDSLTTGLFKTLFHKILHTNCDLVLFEFRRCFKNGRRQNIKIASKFSSETTQQEFIALSGESMCTLCIKRTLFNGLRFPETFLAEDVVMVPIVCSRASKIIPLEFIGYNYSYTPNSLSTTSSPRMLDNILTSANLLREYWSENFSEELIFREIRLICYNFVFVALRLEYPISEIKRTVQLNMSVFPNWKANHYIDSLPFRKKLFIKMVGRGYFKCAKIYVRCQNLILQILNRIRGIVLTNKNRRDEKTPCN